jgi:hypothetical protein
MAEAHAHAEFHVDEAALSGAILPILTRKGNSLVRRTANQARADVPVRTGNMGRTIGEDPVRPTGPFSVSGGVHAGGRQAPYTIPVHEGSRPHKIRARRAPMLRFFWERVGRNVAFRSVNHPGVAARPFLRNAAIRTVATDPDVKIG